MCYVKPKLKIKQHKKAKKQKSKKAKKKLN